MTHPSDVACGRDLVARWCAFAEQRLEYLTELFETGRWRRFHTEREFLENIQEAKAAVELWRSLATREASRSNSALEVSWLGRPGAKLQPYEDTHRHNVKADRLVSNDLPSVPDLDTIEERYPLLRNAL